MDHYIVIFDGDLQMKRISFFTGSAFVCSVLGYLFVITEHALLTHKNPHYLTLFGLVKMFAILFLLASLVIAVGSAAFDAWLKPSHTQTHDLMKRALIAASAVLGLVCFFQVTGGKGYDVSTKTQCMNNMRLIQNATEAIALQRNLAAGSQVPQSDIINRLGGSLPTCPDGGTYIYGKVGQPPVCSTHGALP
jgi:hypothetical protein